MRIAGRKLASLGGICLLGLLPIGGCVAFSARVILLQPAEISDQHRVSLSSDWAFFSVTEAGRGMAVLHFPLPGAESGRRVFHAYFETPAVEGRFELKPMSTNGVRGFLIQDVGKLRGKTEFASGTVRTKNTRSGSRGLYIQLDIVCEDGTRIIGSARLLEQADEVAAFRVRYAADIAELRTP